MMKILNNIEVVILCSWKFDFKIKIDSNFTECGTAELRIDGDKYEMKKRQVSAKERVKVRYEVID